MAAATEKDETQAEPQLTLVEVQRDRERWMRNLAAEAKLVETQIKAALVDLMHLRAKRDEIDAMLRDLRPRRRRAQKGAEGK